MRNQKLKTKPMNMKNKSIHQDSARNSAEKATSQTSITTRNGLLGRRTFMKRVGLAGTALVPASTLLTGRSLARASGLGHGRSRGGVAIPKFRAAPETLPRTPRPQSNRFPPSPTHPRHAHHP